MNIVYISTNFNGSELSKVEWSVRFWQRENA